ncbi:acyl-CoA dehydrogenase family protein [Caldilinea sp.]|uniref:acyl-CoA dehydrogenase family protein n=1 Tax=Caldilinea sp. TaxID=2293560 RepID=UPI003136B7ED|nr:acyl-CoA dehydrogenase family protein [Anaerolineales bacterium]
MYSFDMTSEQKMLVDTVRRYAEKNLRAVYREAEESKQVPDKVVQMGWELGLLPGFIDAQYGGYGEYSALTSALYLEEMAWGDLGISLHLLTPNLFAIPIAQFGNDKQKEQYLALFCNDSFPRATAALVEPVVQFDPAELRTTAVKEGDGFVINGKKTYVPLAKQAEFFLVYAQEGGVTQAYIVPGDTPGIKIGKRVKLMGVQALEMYEVEFENVAVPKANRLGGLKGIRIQKLLTLSRITLAALAVGMARAAYEYAVAYAKDRVAFGEPIAHRQSIAFMLANMRIEIEGTRLMVWEAAYKFDAGEDAAKAALLAKIYADKMVLDVTDGAVQVLGGHGYIREHPVELWLRNGRGFVTMDGAVVA